jgi:hypothetical protein
MIKRSIVIMASPLPPLSQQRRAELRTEPRTLTRGRIRPATATIGNIHLW